MNLCKIRFADLSEVIPVQNVFNHKSIIECLGGFTMEDSIRDKIRKVAGSLWAADLNGSFVGATMFAGRPQSHIVKYGEVGVLEGYRRKRIGSALYLAMTLQGIVEGRRLFEDTIVGDNPTQFFVLPTLGLDKVGELRHKTASAKPIVIFQFSLLDEGKFEQMIGRVPDTFEITIRSSSYTDDLWNKNMDIYKKHTPDFIPKIEKMLKTIQDLKYINIVRQEPLVKEKKERPKEFFKIESQVREE